MASALQLPRSPSPPSLLPQLTPAFALGWSKLPIELKTQILRHRLVSPIGISSSLTWKYITNTMPTTRHVTLAGRLRRHLAMGNDIASLAREVYYKHNTFIIRTSGEGLRYRVSLPPRSTRSLIRSLCIQVYLSSSNWDVLQRLAAGKYGFDELRHVTVHVRWPHRPDPTYIGLMPEKWHRWAAISFACRGEVVFEKDMAREKEGFVDRYLEGKGTDREDVERWVRGIVGFGA
ncbi:hypothetical protein EK21DRAFT_109145 [Setomelanomma holmii]|uniref:Uncharacterized protein n=1 Tax=Setomelanomma holmii TaxID=210430 RepID=A0A9P4HFK5_9PLEO|nr:hypothetical protein EK21DRAFT_109145 [Setomelanomma holmii]